MVEAGLDHSAIQESKQPNYLKRVIIILPVLFPLLLVIYAIYTYGYNSLLNGTSNELTEAWILTFASMIFLALNGFLFALVAGADESQEKGFAKLGAGIQTIKENFANLLTTSILFFVVTTVGLFMLIIPGLIAAIAFYLYPFVVIKEKKKNFGALKRSASIVKKGWFRTLVWIGFYYLLFIVIGVTVYMVIPAIGEAAGETLAGAFVLPFEAMTFYLLYKKLKTKLAEGL
ncbi:hypothetical protein [Alteribacter populi]|uniref:hypothetical protein n=1 Tax=Alteribacter populi TaxID=2011011 RepID=UPI000BBA639C|nr:hypothetical protein [Alteribacter populi]